MVGGMNHLDTFDIEPHRLFHQVYQEVTRILHIQGDPVFGYEKKYMKAIPQYHVGHSTINAQGSGIFLTGNYLNGPSVPQCIENSSHFLAEIH